MLSLKSSDTKRMYDAYVLAAEKCRYPLHLGVTEAGTEGMGVIKSAAGIGGLLLRDIGATIRISLTDDPVKEVEAGIKLLKAIDKTKVKTVALAGGVSANSYIRKEFLKLEEQGIKIYMPDLKLCTDNAAMIAIAGWYHYQNGERSSLDVAPVSRLAEF